MTKSELYKHVSDYEIFTRYLGRDFALSDMMSSPFRKDENPSFNIFRHYKGELIFKDFAYGTGDAIKFVCLLRDLKRSDAISLIAKDFDIENREKVPYKPIILEKKKTLIDIRTRPFTIEEALYWHSYGIDNEMLNKYNVKSIERFRINNSKWFYSRGYCFAYVFNEGTKIYKPFDDDYKWITNCQGGLQGWEQIPIVGNNLVITKSLKDIMVLKSFKVSAVAPHGEGNTIEEELIEELKKRFRNIYVLYDIDRTGYKNSKELCDKYGFKQIFVNDKLCIHKNKNEIKDVSDFRKNKGEKATKELIRTWFPI